MTHGDSNEVQRLRALSRPASQAAVVLAHRSLMASTVALRLPRSCPQHGAYGVAALRLPGMDSMRDVVVYALIVLAVLWVIGICALSHPAPSREQDNSVPDDLRPETR